MKSKFIKGLLEKYKQHPCLWDMADSNYHNNREKMKSYREILLYYRQVEPEATLEIVKSKIANMRGTFRRELKKVIKSKKAGDIPVYTPRVWYYDQMLFLLENMTAVKGNNDVNIASMHDDNSNCSEDAADETDWDKRADESGDVDMGILIDSKQSKSRKRKMNDEMELLFDEEFEAIAKNVAFKLKRMNERQRSFAEILINQAIVYGISNRLREESSITPINPFSKTKDDDEDD